MRIRILGAGAVGGYFGCHLVENRANVTFIVDLDGSYALKKWFEYS